MTEPGTVPGTISYMSPEQARGEKLDHRSDLFSLGVVLYELLSGIQPFRRESKAQTYTALLTEQAPALDSVLESSHPAAAWVLDRALQKDRKLRFQSSSDFRAAIDHLQRSSDVYTAPAVSVAAPSAARALRELARTSRALRSWWRAVLGDRPRRQRPQPGNSSTAPTAALRRAVRPSYVQLTDGGRQRAQPQPFSPDGRFLAYSMPATVTTGTSSRSASPTGKRST